MYPGLGNESKVLASVGAVGYQQPTHHPVAQVGAHAILVGRAVIPRMGQNQAAPLVQRKGDRLKRLAFPGEILAYHRDVVTAHWVKSHDQHDVVSHGRSLPARTQNSARSATAADPGTLIRLRR